VEERSGGTEATWRPDPGRGSLIRDDEGAVDKKVGLFGTLREGRQLQARDSAPTRKS